MGSGARHALREALVWASAALAGLALFNFYDDLTAALPSGSETPREAARSQARRSSELAAHVAGFDREVRLKADERGHFVIEATINERPVTLMADTGATVVVLAYEETERLGLAPRSLDFSGLVQTANGTAGVTPLTLAAVRVADIALGDVPGAGAERGALDVNLPGMSFLSRLKSFQMSGRELVLVQ